MSTSTKLRKVAASVPPDKRVLLPEKTKYLAEDEIAPSCVFVLTNVKRLLLNLADLLEE